MLAIEASQGLDLLIVMRGQRHREAGNTRLQPDIHQPGDNRTCDEVMPIDAAIDDEGCGDDGIVFSGLRKLLGQQRHLERARHVEGVDPGPRHQSRDLCGKALMRAIDDIGVPTRLDEGDAGVGGLGHHFGTFR